MNSAYSSFLDGTASLAGSIVGGFRDPINIAVGLVPIYGVEATVGRAVMGSSKGVARALGARFLTGAAEDVLINGTLLTPWNMSLRSELGDNPTIEEYFHSVAIGGLIGGSLRGIGGLIVDPKGTKLTSVKTVPKTETENRIENMSPKELDSAGTYAVQADIRGVDMDMDALLEMSSSFEKTTVGESQRALASDFLAYKLGLQEEPEVIIKRVGDKTVAEATINGVTYSAKAETEQLARSALEKRISNSINKRILPKITSNGDGTFTAQYSRDKGPARELVGYGRSEAEAVKSLHTLYDNALSPNKKFKQQADRERTQAVETRRRAQLVQKDIQDGTVSTYGTGGGQFRELARQAIRYRKAHAAGKADLEAKYKADYAEAKTPAEKAKLTRQLKKDLAALDTQLESNLKSLMDEAKMFEQDAAIREANSDNIDLDVFKDPAELSEAEYIRKVNELMNHRNEKVTAELSDRSTIAATYNKQTSTPVEVAKYTDTVESTVRTAKLIKELPEDIKENVLDLTKADTDARVMASKEAEEVFRSFAACERGL